MPLNYSFLLIFFSFSTLLVAQDRAVKSVEREAGVKPLSFFEFVSKDSISLITLIADFSTIRKNKYEEEYYSGQLRFTDSENQLQNLSVSFRTRGKSRKKVCYHPGLKIKFPKKELKARGLSEDNKYKLVCQCNSGKPYQQTLLREFLAYKIYNLISPNSFQVHLFEIDYIESYNSGKDTHFGFLLESTKSLGERLNGKIINRDEITLHNISRTESIRMSLFQYMIANTDWNVLALHNVKLLLKEDGEIIPIPYDFDYSGLAKSPYALPNPDYPVKSITDRHFLSADYTEAEINEQLIYFHLQKEAIHQLITDFSPLTRWSKRFVNRFINNFYKTIENPKRVIRELVK